MTQLSMKLGAGDIANVKLMLGALSKAGDTVIKQAVNRTLTGVRTDTTNEVSKVITPTKKKIRSTVTVSKMTAGDGNAFVKCTGGPLNLIEFKARQTKKGVTVQVKKSSGRSLIKHAFIQTMKNGEKLVLWRKVINGKRVARYPIEAKASLAIPDVMGHEPTMNEILRLADDRLKKNLNDRLNYELNRLR
jgi:Prophage minor tail protein Z (GPZ)